MGRQWNFTPEKQVALEIQPHSCQWARSSSLILCPTQAATMDLRIQRQWHSLGSCTLTWGKKINGRPIFSHLMSILLVGYRPFPPSVLPLCIPCQISFCLGLPLQTIRALSLVRSDFSHSSCCLVTWEGGGDRIFRRVWVTAWFICTAACLEEGGGTRCVGFPQTIAIG